MKFILSVSGNWGLVGYMGSEILTTNGKFIFNTPITRDVHEIWYRHCEDNTPNKCWKPYCKAKNHFCWDHERMSGTIASYDTSSGTYQIGMCDNHLLGLYNSHAKAASGRLYLGKF